MSIWSSNKKSKKPLDEWPYKVKDSTKSSLFKQYINGIIYKVDLDPDPDLQKKRTRNLYKNETPYKNSLYKLKTHVLISNMKIVF